MHALEQCTHNPGNPYCIGLGRIIKACRLSIIMHTYPRPVWRGPIHLLVNPNCYNKKLETFRT